MKKRLLTLISIILTIPALCFAQNPKHQPLKLTVYSEKKVFKVNDELILRFEIENTSKKTIIFLRDTNPTHKNLIITSETEKHCRIAESSQVPASSNALVSLLTGDVFEYSLTGKIVQDKKEVPLGKHKKDGFEERDGLFLEFPTYSIYLEDGFGKYKVKARYTDGGWALDPTKKIPKDLWRGTLFSEPIEIKITDDH